MTLSLFFLLAIPLLIAWVVTRPPHSPDHVIPPAIMTGIGGSLGLVTYAITFVVTMAVVPRTSEGSRSVVDLPWPVYVSLPTTLAFLPLLLLGLMIPRRKWNLFFIAGFNIAVAGLATSGSVLLRRDYIGKF